MANLYQLLTWPGKFRSRRIQLVHGDDIGKFRLTRLIGKGATCVAYEAEPWNEAEPLSPLKRKAQAKDASFNSSGECSSPDDADVDHEDLSKMGKVDPCDLVDGQSAGPGTRMPLMSNAYEIEDSDRQALDALVFRDAPGDETSYCLDKALAMPETGDIENETVNAVVIGSPKPAMAPSTPASKLIESSGPGDSMLTTPLERVQNIRNGVCLKFSSDKGRLELELQVERLLPDKYKIGLRQNVYGILSLPEDCFHAVHMSSNVYSSEYYAVVGPLLKPLEASILSKPNNFGPTLEKGHFLHLLSNIMAIHTAGYVHRDIRLPNLLLKKSINQYILADFGCACQLNQNVLYSGTIITASQRVLQKLIKDPGSAMLVSPEDDLESLLKCYLLSLYGHDWIASKSCKHNSSEEYRWLFNLWMSDYIIELFIRLSSYDLKTRFLLKLFRQPLGAVDADRIYKEAVPKQQNSTKDLIKTDPNS